MSGHTFKIGDRVRCGRYVGTVDMTDGTWFRIGGRDSWGSSWSMWVDGAGCNLAPPMSPEARMVWHAMRAGAKRTTNDLTIFKGQRLRTYRDGDGIFLTIRGDYRAEVQS